MAIIVYVMVKVELNGSKSKGKDKGERTSTIKAKASQNQKKKDDETVIKGMNMISTRALKGLTKPSYENDQKSRKTVQIM